MDDNQMQGPWNGNQVNQHDPSHTPRATPPPFQGQWHPSQFSQPEGRQNRSATPPPFQGQGHPSQFSQPEGSQNQSGTALNFQGQWWPSQNNLAEWNPYMHGFMSGPHGYFPQNVMHPPPNAAMRPTLPPHLDNSGGDDEVVVITSPVGASRRKERGKVKQANFTPEEDVNLVKSWLEISCDPVVNTGQKNEIFWVRVIERYDTRRGDFPIRNDRSLQGRWDKIRAASSKFAGYLAEAHRVHASGTSDADKTTMAAATYAGVENTNFPYMHCWEFLKDEPKWQDLRPSKGKPVAQEATADNLTPGVIPIDVEREDSARGPAAKRPIGRDAAKSKGKKSCSTSSSSEYASRMEDLSLQRMSMWSDENSKKVERFDTMNDIESKRFDKQCEYDDFMKKLEVEKVKLQRESVELQRVKSARQELMEDERILKIDLAACTPELRVFYRSRRAAILKKYAANEGGEEPDN